MFLRSLSAELGQPDCGNCRDGEPLDFGIRMAFQPIVDAHARAIYAYEALVRGEDGSGAAAVLARVGPQQLIRDIDASAPRRHIVAGIVGMAAALGCRVLAEGVETPSEYRTLRALGIGLYQGYLFAMPAMEALPELPAERWDRLEHSA